MYVYIVLTAGKVIRLDDSSLPPQFVKRKLVNVGVRKKKSSLKIEFDESFRPFIKYPVIMR
jgi:hypothetical protein